MLTFSRSKTEPIGPVRTRHWLWAVVLVILALAIVHAFRIDHVSLYQTNGEPVGFQTKMAEAFLDGRLDMGPAPAGLVDLANQWDPVANRTYRYDHKLHDFSYFEGRIYSPFGPTPALLLHLPIRAVTGKLVSPEVATLSWTLGILVAAFAAYRILASRFAPHRPAWSELAAVAALGLAGPTIWILSIGRPYEESIVCGSFLLMTGIALLAKATNNLSPPSPFTLAVVGLLFGLAIGARPHLIGAGLLIGISIIWLIRTKPLKWRLCISAICIPYVAIVLLLLAYNYLRFGNPLEFGTSYQMAGYDVAKYPLYSLGNFIPNFSDYLFGGPRFEAAWPHVHLLENTWFDLPDKHRNEPVAGMLTTFPVIALGLRCTPLAIRRAGHLRTHLSVTLGSLALLGAGIIMAISVPFNSSTMRYTVDFIPIFGLIGLIAFMASIGGVSGVSHRPWLTRCWLALLAWSAAVGVLLSLTACPGTGSC